MISGPDGHDLLAIAREAAAKASELVRTNAPGGLTDKGDRDPTSEIDVAVERFLRAFLQKQLPNSDFVGEEEGGPSTGREFLWVLDPIDGTVNYLHGLPLCAVSLSLSHANTVIAAVVDLPFLATQYSALKGHGAYANNKRLCVSETATLDTALVSIDQYTFGEDAERKNTMRLRLARHLAQHVQRIRMLGASAIDLVWTAEGRLDACIILGNKPWDTTAGVLIAREAGARVLDQDGSDHSPQSFATIAVTPPLAADLIAVVRAALAEPEALS